MHLSNLYHCAYNNHIPVLVYPMPQCIQTEQGCVIGMDKGVCDCYTQERTHLAHELGHCLTGSFYNAYTVHDVRHRHEVRADTWAIQTLIPAEKLDEAIASGCTEMWELAEHFGVTEEFMRKAVCWHVHGNLATQLYF